MFTILLLYPFSTSQDPAAGRWYPAEPLGLMYLASYLIRAARRDGLDICVRILDCQLEGPDVRTKTERGYRNGLTDKDICEYLRSLRPDIIGIANNYSFGLNDAMDLARLARVTVPTARIIMGGAHATLDHNNLAQDSAVDFVVRGEGEETFRELVYALLQGQDVQGICGLSYRSPAGGVTVTPNRSLIQNLDEIPIPDRSLIKFQDYLKHPNYFHTMQAPVATAFTSRGCPFHCIFCSTQKTWGNRWRGRSAENMLKEVEYLKEQFGVREIAFQDDQFLGDRQRIIEFCKLVVQRNLEMTFIVPPGNSPAFMNDELLKWMGRAGFYRLCFSVDVGTESAVKFAKKPVNLSKVRHLVRRANQNGIWTYGTFVIGFPFEKREDIWETVRYAYSLKLDFVRFYIAQPHFGSDLYDLYLKQGKLSGIKVNEQHDAMDSFFGTDFLSAAELIALRNEAECGYVGHHWKNFLNPMYLFSEFFPKIASWRRWRYFIGLVKSFSAVTVRFVKKI